VGDGVWETFPPRPVSCLGVNNRPGIGSTLAVNALRIDQTRARSLRAGHSRPQIRDSMSQEMPVTQSSPTWQG
jgi:hypothetical protein